jgi:hypothetical protein
MKKSYLVNALLLGRCIRCAQTGESWRLLYPESWSKRAAKRRLASWSKLVSSSELASSKVSFEIVY